MPDFNTDFYIERFRKMIECKTVSVKDSFAPEEFMKLRDVMRELFPEIHKKAEIQYFSEDCWLYKITGKDTSRNIMLMSHHDVVEATGEWKYPPFAGEVHDGKIWGRGTFDTKASLFAEFTAVEELLAAGFVPCCNLYIGSSHNEERFGDGMPSVNEYFKKEGLRFEVVLDEGGAIITPPVDGVKAAKCAMVGIHEKGRFYYTCTASNQTAYQSLIKARKKNTVERMTAFIEAVNTSDMFIVNLNQPVRDMFTYIAPHISFPLNLAFANLKLTAPIIKKIMPKLNPLAKGLISTTCNFIKIEGSSAEKKCTATAYFQPVSLDDFNKDIESFTKLAEEYGITVTKNDNCDYHEPADIHSEGFRYTKKCIEEVFPENPVVPYVLPSGGTDARVFRDVCDCNLRFTPFKISDKQLDLVHCPNENLDISCIPDGIKFYKHFVKNYR